MTRYLFEKENTAPLAPINMAALQVWYYDNYIVWIIVLWI